MLLTLGDFRSLSTGLFWDRSLLGITVTSAWPIQCIQPSQQWIRLGLRWPGSCLQCPVPSTTSLSHLLVSSYHLITRCDPGLTLHILAAPQEPVWFSVRVSCAGGGGFWNAWNEVITPTWNSFSHLCDKRWVAKISSQSLLELRSPIKCHEWGKKKYVLVALRIFSLTFAALNSERQFSDVGGTLTNSLYPPSLSIIWLMRI